MHKSPSANKSVSNCAPISLLLLGSILFYLATEWLFFATKPSFLSILSVPQKLFVFTGAAWGPLLFTTVFLLVFHALEALFANPAYGRFFHVLLRSIATLVLSCSALLLLDNFTITIFDFGIRSVTGVQKIPYVLLFFLLFIFSFRTLGNSERYISRNFQTRKQWVAPLMVLIVFVFIGVFNFTGNRFPLQPAKNSGPMPNILLIASDGIEADRTSLFGYRKNTTPFIRQFSEGALVAENAYSNGSSTLSSLISILTGRLPTETRLISAPDILRGSDAYKHLPGILKTYGYRTLQLSVRGYADAYDANMRGAFDFVNLRRPDELWSYRISEAIAGAEAAYFLQQTYERLSGRLFHIFGLWNLLDPFLEVTHQKGRAYSDDQRVTEFFRIIRSSEKPFFAHLHLMGTHKAMSLRDDPSGSYDRSIRVFDATFKKIILDLSRMGSLDKTIVVFYSDHGRNHSTFRRMPFMIRFPQGKRKVHLKGIVQNIDIAPTLLQYLGIQQPQWMSGESLIAKSDAGCRWVISVKPVLGYGVQRLDVRAEANQPFYTLGTVSVIACGKFFRLDVRHRKLVKQATESGEEACSTCKVPGSPEVLAFICRHLQENGYDVETLNQKVSKGRKEKSRF